MVKSATGIPADKLELYEKLVATNPSVGRKGVTTPYTSLNVTMRKIFGIRSAIVTTLFALLLFSYLPIVSRVGALTESGAGLELGEWQTHPSTPSNSVNARPLDKSAA